ncbi:amidohydrolase family protein [Synergistaceae bacterium OttesenSCG-928-I11]|nr:amidohydrolase family protein [Synergistaceae bacterium OttesenSCG-928-I11]
MKTTKLRFIIAILAIFLYYNISPAVASEIFAITNVRVFDGHSLSEPTTVVVENGLISNSKNASRTIDAHGGTLLPGLIDSHMHFEGEESLRNSARWGVTTVMDMGTRNLNGIRSLRGQPGLPTVLNSGNSVAPRGGAHAAMGCAVVSDAREARAYIIERIAEKVDYIKVIADSPADGRIVVMDEALLAEMVAVAHTFGRKIVAHVTLDSSVAMCARTDVDVVTHLPLGRPVDAALAVELANKGTTAIPTLCMMACFANRIPANSPSGMDYDNAAASMAALHLAGVRLIAGTDANSTVCSVPHGESLHRELELMVNAGMTLVEALRAATIVPAEYFGLRDRGAISPGLRADLLLIDGDPTVDISATRNIRGVWIGGEQVQLEE